MANLTAVLRKTIDGLPNATPQLRAKVYEKARAAITRQIQAADPPLAEHVVEQRYRVLEDAIVESEAHYQALEAGTPEPAPTPASTPPAIEETRSEPEPVREVPPAPPLVSPMSERSAPQPFPRATPTMRGPAVAAPPPVPPSSRPIEPEEPPRAVRSPVPEPRPVERFSADQNDAPRASDEPIVGVVGPAVEPAPPFERTGHADRGGRTVLRPASPVPAADEDRAAPPSPGAMLSGIPEADLSAPRYPQRKPARRRNNGPLLAGVAVAGLLGIGALGWIYLDDIRSLVLGPTETASLPAGTGPGQTTDTGETAVSAPGTTPDTAAPPSGTVTDTAPAAPATTPPAPGGRQFTQRLLPDGNEVDEGPSPNAPNAFEEGTNVAAATVAPATETSAPPAVDPAANPPADPAPQATPSAPARAPQDQASATVPVGQRAVFYEERSADREGTQQSGNVVWSVTNEPPAEGQPAEPAIRAVVDVPNTNLRMNMTIRRNADTTLPASHVIEIMFDTPQGFPGGAIENVQRLALKPTEQARGEPLIGVAGKISDGFFIIALNDLPQAVQSNLALLEREEWIDIPIAYQSGQRALMSIEKGIPGDRVFREAIAAWNGRT